MSRAFIKEDDGERGNAAADYQFREAKVDWLKIQEKKLETLKNTPPTARVPQEKIDRWIKQTEEDIVKTRRELGYTE